MQSLALTGGRIAESVATRLRPGEFRQTEQEIRSFSVPGAVPTAMDWPGLPASGGVSMSTLMLFGLVVVGVLVLGRK